MDTNAGKNLSKKHSACQNATRAAFGYEKWLKVRARTMNLYGLYSILARLALSIKDWYLDQNTSQNTSFWNQCCDQVGSSAGVHGSLSGRAGEPL